jgi:hypothetical protein
MCVFGPGLFVIIIDSRVKIIGNERPGASPRDPRGRLHANNTKSIVLYNTHFVTFISLENKVIYTNTVICQKYSEM